MIPASSQIDAVQALFPGMGRLQAINHLRGQALARELTSRTRKADHGYCNR